ncbi:MAG: VPLPA-CTERM-specific exosortase XrtD [Rhizobiaceae bacterium]
MTINQNILEDKQLSGLEFSAKSGIFWAFLAVAGMFLFYASGLESLMIAWERPEYSHGYLIAPIALYLFLTQLNEEAHTPLSKTPNRGLGVVLVLFGLIGGLLGNLTSIPDINTYGFIVCTAGLVLVCMGTKRGVRFWPPILYLVFMLPLPNFLYWPLSIQLQMISSEIGVAFIELFNVPVFLGGNVIDLGVYKLQVAEACNGLRYLFPLASFGFLFGVLYKGPAWHKVLLFLSALPVTVLMNSIRIGIIGLLVDSYGIEQAEGFLHSFEGWVIFVACILILFLEAVLLQRFVKNRRPVHEMLEIDFEVLAGNFGKIRSIQFSKTLVFATAIILVSAASWHLVPARVAIIPDRDPLVLFPTQLSEWSGQRQSLEPDIERVLNADDYLLVNYSSQKSAASANLFIAYYKSQTNGSGIHSPEVCIPAGGWEVSNWTKKNTNISFPDGSNLEVNRAIISQGLNQQLVYYWFEQRGRHLTGDYATKGYTVLDSMTRGRTDGALVRVLTPILPGEKMEMAETRLQGFLKTTLAELPDYLPK